MFRMAHVFLALGQFEQAQHVATNTAQALRAENPLASRGRRHCRYTARSTWSWPWPAARDNQRALAHQHLDTAAADRQTAR
jgi:hypothetical protein